MQKIVPCLWFNRNAEEAIKYYLSIFPEGKILDRQYYPTEWLLDFQQEFAGKVLTIDFELFWQRYLALNAGDEFQFNESISFIINCKDQGEIDYYWQKLTADGGQKSVCGWLKDKYGMSWQISPENWQEMMKKPWSFEKMLTMKKIIIADL